MVELTDDAVMNYFGHLVYGRDYRRCYALGGPRRSRSERALDRLAVWLQDRRYNAGRRRAGRELRRWGISPVDWSTDSATTEQA